jgi:hypothetical protein
MRQKISTHYYRFISPTAVPPKMATKNKKYKTYKPPITVPIMDIIHPALRAP